MSIALRTGKQVNVSRYLGIPQLIRSWAWAINYLGTSTPNPCTDQGASANEVYICCSRDECMLIWNSATQFKVPTVTNQLTRLTICNSVSLDDQIPSRKPPEKTEPADSLSSSSSKELRKPAGAHYHHWTIARLIRYLPTYLPTYSLQPTAHSSTAPCSVSVRHGILYAALEVGSTTHASSAPAVNLQCPVTGLLHQPSGPHQGASLQSRGKENKIQGVLPTQSRSVPGYNLGTSLSTRGLSLRPLLVMNPISFTK